jgi:hypothetical protein
LENILHLNDGSSREFAFEPIEKEKVGWCDIRAVGWMRDSLESELRHLFQIGLGIVGLGAIHMEHFE